MALPNKPKGIFSDSTAEAIESLRVDLSGYFNVWQKLNPLATKRDVDRAEARILAAIKEIGGGSTGGDISVADQQALDNLVTAGEALCIRVEKLAVALAALDAQQ